MNKKERNIQRKIVFKHTAKIGSAVKTCRYCGIGWASFYGWTQLYKNDGWQGRSHTMPFHNQLKRQITEFKPVNGIRY